MDASDFTRCVNCNCSLCLIDGSWFDRCLKCYSPICFPCQEKHKIRKKVKVLKYHSDPEDILPPYKLHHEDADDWDHTKGDEPGILGGCPWCNNVTDEDVLSYLIEQSGKTREEIEKEIQDA